MLYHWYELSHAAVRPARAAADTCRLLLDNPFNPMSHTAIGRHTSAACEVFERTTRRYDKPSFGIDTTSVDGAEVGVSEEEIWRRPFCRVLHFKRDIAAERADKDPKVLLVAPMSGHFATLLRGTVETLLPDHEVFITDWQDARDVPASAGAFDLDDYIDYVIAILEHFKGDVHVFAVCQPSVPVLAAVSRMEADGNANVPCSLILAGGPIDTRVSPTVVNKLAQDKGTDWFAQNVISVVPWPNMGTGRLVYPGFLQLTGFMTMNLDRHVNAHKDLFQHLIEGDGDSAEKHCTFYDEYLAVMDLTAEFYLQTIESVFVRHSLATGEMRHRDKAVDPGKIRRVALMTIEGEKDDITGLGQCRAAQYLATGLDAHQKYHFEAPGVGHYGIFNGSRFRADIAPRIAQFIRSHDLRADQMAVVPLPANLYPATNPTIHGADVSANAFTFEPANDTRPDAMAARLKSRGLTGGRAVGMAGGRDYGQVSGKANGLAAARKDDPNIFDAFGGGPFRFWAMASRMMLDNFWGSGPRQ